MARWMERDGIAGAQETIWGVKNINNGVASKGEQRGWTRWRRERESLGVKGWRWEALETTFAKSGERSNGTVGLDGGVYQDCGGGKCFCQFNSFVPVHPLTPPRVSFLSSFLSLLPSLFLSSLLSFVPSTFATVVLLTLWRYDIVTLRVRSWAQPFVAIPIHHEGITGGWTSNDPRRNNLLVLPCFPLITLWNFHRSLLITCHTNTHMFSLTIRKWGKPNELVQSFQLYPPFVSKAFHSTIFIQNSVVQFPYK